MSANQSVSADDGFDAWNEPEEQKQETQLSTAKNIAEVSESSNIISESAETEQDSISDLR
jgi:hypothetical protein